MARPENRSEARALSLTLPIETFNYLVLLANLGKLGRTENEVATHILVRETYAMIERRFHETAHSAAERWRGRIDLPAASSKAMVGLKDIAALTVFLASDAGK